MNPSHGGPPLSRPFLLLSRIVTWLANHLPLRLALWLARDDLYEAELQAALKQMAAEGELDSTLSPPPGRDPVFYPYEDGLL